MNRENTAAYRILTYLQSNRGTSFTNSQLATILALPSDSVRRVVNELRSAGRVIADPILNRHWQAA